MHISELYPTWKASFQVIRAGIMIKKSLASVLRRIVCKLDKVKRYCFIQMILLLFGLVMTRIASDSQGSGLSCTSVMCNDTVSFFMICTYGT